MSKRSLLILLILLFITTAKALSNQRTETNAARGVIERVAGKQYAKWFDLKIVSKHEGMDYYEIEPNSDGRIVIRGTSGVAICTGFNYYLKHFCNSQYTWRGTNIHLPERLPADFSKIRKVSPLKYRYIFNYCVFSYSMAFWQWEDWERMIDWMALNGINMPLALNGQEYIWQKTFEKFGLTQADMQDFFTGPAYLAWWRMGGLDGWGGPLSQHWIENDRQLQHKILERERSLGMKPILQGFAGHIPEALVKKNKNIKYSNLSWCDFPQVYILDWDEPLFSRIGETFIREMKKEYGTDHYYAIDPFNEMEPKNSDLKYLKNMGATIFEGMDNADPKGIWLLMTWAFKNPEWAHNFWQKERTAAFFSGIPDERVIALDLHCESWDYTAWRKLDGFFNKPWIWGIIQNFGDRVNMFGGLQTINDHFKAMLNNPGKGNFEGMGLFMEGLDYNPVVFEMFADMSWEAKPLDLDSWKWKYIESRYGKITPEIKEAWEIIYDYYYTKVFPFSGTILLGRPFLKKTDSWPNKKVVRSVELMMKSAGEFKNNDAFQYDLINLLRELYGDYASHLLFEVTEAFLAKKVDVYEKKVRDFLTYIEEFDELLGTRKEFLLGKWINDAKACAGSPEEERLFEWNAKNLITLWGPKGHCGCGGLQGYASRQWSGFFKDYSLPLWKMYFERKADELRGKTFDKEAYIRELMDKEEAWTLTTGDYPSVPQGDPVKKATQMWKKYGEKIKEGSRKAITADDFKRIETAPGMAVGKPITASCLVEEDHGPEKAVDGKVELESAWWGKPAPQSLTIDLEKVETIFGFHVIPYWDWERFYQYTIEISDDKTTWHEIVDMRNNKEMATPNGHQHIFKVKYPQGFKARYVRINMLHNSANEGVHLVEFKVFRGEDIP